MSFQRGLEPFDPQIEDVDSYVERLEQNVSEERKVAQL